MPILRYFLLAFAIIALAACGSNSSSSSRNQDDSFADGFFDVKAGDSKNPRPGEEERETIWDLFTNKDNPNTTLEVNRYIWNASLDVLDFMPVQSIDPFSGVIVMGYGVPPGGRTSYRATVYVQDPALDARSLRVAMATHSGPVNAQLQRQIEDAILTRARQLRLQDDRY